MNRCDGVVLAAGMSSRMGAFKPLLPLGGKTVIECTVDSLLAGGAAQVTVVLGRRAPDVAALLQKRYPPNVLTLAVNAAYETTDMLASVKLGLRALPPCGGAHAVRTVPGTMRLNSSLASWSVPSGAHCRRHRLVAPLAVPGASL